MAKLAGVSFPFRLENNGVPAQAIGFDAIRSCLTLLLKTDKRSRVMKPALGVDLQRLMFEVQGPVLNALIREEISTAVAEFLPQVRIQDIVFRESGTKIYVNVRYTIQNVQDETGEIEFRES